MTSNDLQELFARHGVEDLSLRSEVEQFAKMSADDRMVYLFLTVRAQRPKPISQRLFEYASVAAWVAYALLDQRDNLPKLGGQ